MKSDGCHIKYDPRKLKHGYHEQVAMTYTKGRKINGKLSKVFVLEKFQNAQEFREALQKATKEAQSWFEKQSFDSE